ncbi:hypothetical protein CBL_07759 [Carabus blaptoides fortunei]
MSVSHRKQTVSKQPLDYKDNREAILAFNIPLENFTSVLNIKFDIIRDRDTLLIPEDQCNFELNPPRCPSCRAVSTKVLGEYPARAPAGALRLSSRHIAIKHYY